MTSTAVTTERLQALRLRVGGSVILPEDPGFDEARRVWNGMIDRRPLAVVRAATAGDVVPVVELAREHSLPLALRGGGHGVAGNGTVDGGIVLDLGHLDYVRVDAASRTVRVEAGATIGAVDRATGPYGLAVPLGVVSMTGVAGLTLGGGFGWLTRSHGLTADNLLAADVVTAAGDTVRAGDDGDPELLWGLRGGGGNFGVVTSFTFRAHPLLDEPYGVNLVYREPAWRGALRAWEEWTRDLPDEMQSIISVFAPPPAFDLGDAPLLMVGCAWSGPDRADGDRLVDALRSAAPPDGEETSTASWATWQSAMDDLVPKGSRAYWKNSSFDRLDEEVIEVLCRRGAEQTWQGTAFDVHHMGGAFARVPAGSSPFPDRTSRFWINTYGFWADPGEDEARTEFVRAVAREMEPFSTGGRYVNFMAPEGGTDRRAQALAVYGQPTLDRLVALKRRYDPGNLFRLNHNVPPD